MASAKVISAQEGRQLMQDLGEKLLILDVRHADEFNRGHIPHAQSLDNDEIRSDEKHPQLPQDLQQPILIYCRSGVRSNIAMKKLQMLGYSTLYDMGGILNWPYEVER